MDFSILEGALRDATPDKVREVLPHFAATAGHLGLPSDVWRRPDAAATIYGAWERAPAEAQAGALLEFARAARVLGCAQLAEILEGGVLALRLAGASVRVGRA